MGQGLCFSWADYFLELLNLMRPIVYQSTVNSWADVALLDKIFFLYQKWLLKLSVVPHFLGSVHSRRLVFINHFVLGAVIPHRWHTYWRLMDLIIFFSRDTSCKLPLLLWLTSIFGFNLNLYFGSFRLACCVGFTFFSLLSWVLQFFVSDRVYFLVQVILQDSEHLLTMMLKTNSCLVWSTSEILITVGFLFGSFKLITGGAVCLIANFLFSSATKDTSCFS